VEVAGEAVPACCAEADHRKRSLLETVDREQQLPEVEDRVVNNENTRKEGTEYFVVVKMHYKMQYCPGATAWEEERELENSNSCCMSTNGYYTWKKS